MAYVEYIDDPSFGTHRNEDAIRRPLKKMDLLPHLFWNDGKPWRAANRWAGYQARTPGTGFRVIEHRMAHLCMYANWLEQENLNWKQFPESNPDWVVLRYRQALSTRAIYGDCNRAWAFSNIQAILRFYEYHAKRKPKKNKWLLDLIRRCREHKYGRTIIFKSRVKCDGQA